MGQEPENDFNLDAFPSYVKEDILKAQEALNKPVNEAAGKKEEPKDKGGDPKPDLDKGGEDDGGGVGDGGEPEEIVPFVGKVGGKKAGVEGLKIENFDVLGNLFSQAGVKVEKPEDLPGVVEEIKTLRSKSEGYESQIQDLSDYKTVFENLPPDLFAVVQAYLSDEDYRKQMVTVSGSFVDFTKGFGDNNMKNLIDYYYPGKFSAEDYEDIQDTKEFKILKETVQSKFESDKNRLEKQRDEYIQSRANEKKVYLDSVVKSIEKLEKSNILDQASLNEVKKVAGSGVNGILGLFVDKNGNITPEGAERLALAMHGKRAINQLVDRASRKAVSREREEIIERGDPDKKKKGSTPASQVPDDVKDYYNRVLPKTNRNVF